MNKLMKWKQNCVWWKISLSSLVDGVIGAEDAELLPDAVVDEGVFEVHAVAPDQRHQLVELHLGYDLKEESEWQI